MKAGGACASPAFHVYLQKPHFREPLLPALDRQPAILVLADGTVFRGLSIGAQTHTSGEVVFNTAMTGYQEILTDPSYCRQIVTLTYPHIGNVGVNPEDAESNRVFAAGLVIRDLPIRASNFRMRQDLPDYLREHNVPAIAGIDTRKLTRILRDKGAQSGCLMGGKVDEAFALQQARAFPGLAGMDLAKVVSCDKPYQWNQSEWALGEGYRTQATPKYHVVAYDYGVKRNILRMLASRGCKLTVLPAQASAEEALAFKPDGVFLSNGPGDPEPCDYAIQAIGKFLDAGVPTFGICLGHQLLGLASGGAHDQDEVRPPWRQPPRAGSRNRPRHDYEPEPRIRGGRDDAAREREESRMCRCSMAACRASPAPTSRRFVSRAIRKRVRDRTTSITCSTVSSQ